MNKCNSNKLQILSCTEGKTQRSGGVAIWKESVGTAFWEEDTSKGLRNIHLSSQYLERSIKKVFMNYVSMCVCMHVCTYLDGRAQGEGKEEV